LELGGSDPFIVFPSGNWDEAAETAAFSRTLNNGQSCIAAKRFIVHETIAPQFLEKLRIQFASLKVGDPMDAETDIGPLATEAVFNTIAQQVDQAVGLGAKVLIGGQKLEGPGYFYPPTILTNLPADAPLMKEEFFGPVALVFTVPEIESAIALANNTPFGLGSSVWTTDPEEQTQFIRDIEAGAVFINGLVKSDPRLPFGGIKRSGYGRELALPGIRAFVNAKTVWIK
jgi:succinate-semialdehyde dehydrogenase/glutarate-semialdehyde dehydrogenase